MLNRFSVRRKILLVVAVPIMMLVVVAAVGFNTQRTVAVGSNNYDRIVTSKDLVADILPPPGFLVESYLTVQQLANSDDNAERSELEARLAQFEREYNQTHDKWMKDELVIDDEIRSAFLQDSFTSASQFYQVVNDRFLPLVDSDDRDAALTLANTELKDIYETHRASIVDTVELATAKQVDIEQDTTSLASSRSALTIAVSVIGLGLALIVSAAVARAITRSVSMLRSAATDVATKLASTAGDGNIPDIAPVSLGTTDELADAADAFNAVVGTTLELLERQARGRQALSEMFVNLGRRNQNLVSRQLRLVDELERTEADSEALKKLFKLDHIATRMRRNAESLLVMAGLETPRKWKKAVPLMDVIRSAVSEVEQFERVEVTEIAEVRISGGAAANLSHLVAELTENALRYSPPDTAVTIASEAIKGGGVAVTITDQGTGMTDADLDDANERLANPPRLEDAPTAYLGHFVVSRLAERHDIAVRLHSAEVGISAEISLPADILSALDGEDTPADRDGYQRARAVAKLEAARSKHVADDGPTVLDTPSVFDSPSQAAAPAPAAPVATQPVSTPAPAATPAPKAETVPQTESLPATALSSEPSPAEVTAAGYKKRAPRKPAADAGFDRFATPTQENRPRSADAVRNRLDNFKAGKTRAVEAERTDGDTEGSIVTDATNDDKQGA